MLDIETLSAEIDTTLDNKVIKNKTEEKIKNELKKTFKLQLNNDATKDQTKDFINAVAPKIKKLRDDFDKVFNLDKKTEDFNKLKEKIKKAQNEAEKQKYIIKIRQKLDELKQKIVEFNFEKAMIQKNKLTGGLAEIVHEKDKIKTLLLKNKNTIETNNVYEGNTSKIKIEVVKINEQYQLSFTHNDFPKPRFIKQYSSFDEMINKFEKDSLEQLVDNYKANTWKGDMWQQIELNTLEISLSGEKKNIFKYIMEMNPKYIEKIQVRKKEILRSPEYTKMDDKAAMIKLNSIENNWKQAIGFIATNLETAKKKNLTKDLIEYTAWKEILETRFESMPPEKKEKIVRAIHKEQAEEREKQINIFSDLQSEDLKNAIATRRRSIKENPANTRDIEVQAVVAYLSNNYSIEQYAVAMNVIDDFCFKDSFKSLSDLQTNFLKLQKKENKEANWIKNQIAKSSGSVDPGDRLENQIYRAALYELYQEAQIKQAQEFGFINKKGKIDLNAQKRFFEKYSQNTNTKREDIMTKTDRGWAIRTFNHKNPNIISYRNMVGAIAILGGSVMAFFNLVIAFRTKNWEAALSYAAAGGALAYGGTLQFKNDIIGQMLHPEAKAKYFARSLASGNAGAFWSFAQKGPIKNADGPAVEFAKLVDWEGLRKSNLSKKLLGAKKKGKQANKLNDNSPEMITIDELKKFFSGEGKEFIQQDQYKNAIKRLNNDDHWARNRYDFFKYILSNNSIKGKQELSDIAFHAREINAYLTHKKFPK